MIIIADSGGTKTEWRFINKKGQITQLKSSGLNPNYLENNEIAVLLKKEVSMVIEEPIQHLYFYGAGCADQHNQQRLTALLGNHFEMPPERIALNHDLTGAARASAGREKGIVCILGTGSNACLYNGNAIVKKVQNLGFILGDEGSGAYMGKTLLKDYFEEKLTSELSALFKTDYPDLTRDVLIKKLYHQGQPNKFLASFFRFIIKNQGHPYCQSLITSAFDSFVEKYVIPFDQANELPVHFIGGVAHHANQYLRKILTQKNLQTGLIMESPIAGLTLYHQNEI